jgi:probable HAF family extracellular repeat protein
MKPLIHLRSTILVACLGLVTFPAAPSLHAQATLTDLGDLGGGQSDAEGLNNEGQVVGYSTTSSGDTDAFLYSNGTMTNLGILAGDTDSAATGINDSGQIVGYSGTTSTFANYNGVPNPGYNGTAFLYSGGTMTDLSTSVGGTSSAATGINNSGQVVGYSTASSGESYAFLYSGGAVTNLGFLGSESGVYSSSLAFGINSSGQVVGGSSTNDAGRIAFSYSVGTMTNLGSLPGPNVSGGSAATAINSSGLIVGGSGLPGVANAFLYSNGTLTNLGTLGGTNPNSLATGINDSGEIVGYSGTGFGALGPSQAFVDLSGTMQSLNSLYASMLVSGTGSQTGFVSLVSANAIDAAGDIAGVGTYWNGTSDQQEAFLLDVPEPSTWALLLGGLATLALWRKRARPFALALLAAGSIGSADAQIYVTNTSSNSIDEYNLDGTLEQSGFITGLDAPTYIAAGGSDIYVFNSGNDTLDEYNASGTQINPGYLPSSSELTNVVGLSASDSEFTVWYNNGANMIIQPTNELLTGVVGAPPEGYVSTGNGTAYGAAATARTPLNLEFTGIADQGNSVFTAVNNTSTGVGGIGIYTGEAGKLTAFTSDTLTVNGLTNGPTLLAVSGSNLYEYNSGNGTIGEFTTSGQQVAGQLVTLANGTTATGLAATATDLYTLQSNGSILDTSVGSGTSSVLISGLSSPGGFAVEAVPEPSTWALLLGGLTTLALWRKRARQLPISLGC